MKTIKLFTISFLLSFTFSCDDDNNIGVNTISTTIEDLHAPQEGGKVKQFLVHLPNSILKQVVKHKVKQIGTLLLEEHQ
tara:strand:+ start:2203 stop:2439 length:237 start_codon:yes stop_codon:yes gene_type:complete